MMPSTKRPPDEPSRPGDEVAEDAGEGADVSEEYDSDAPGLGIVRDDLEDTPEPNEPS